MYRKIEDFESIWKYNIDATKKIFSALTDESLKYELAKDHRDLGRMAWHIVMAIPEMMSRVGFKFDGPTEKDPVPEKADEITGHYESYANSLLDQVKKEWTDETLLQEDDMYGETWKRGMTLNVLVNHEIHHRGQMTALMRLAGLKIPGVFGPAKEEWAQYGMDEPEL
jgi:uncharacterized damage-inducible protein DinB